ncbi:MAG TPA: YggS family pyridoxal phosphate-dependent enzyme, partial [Alphaproteobacteria bacterium]|nr:YggS family pyridoxal phosphate-dependent enzyme [Alphaproteobacteria bacterium]
MSLSDIKAGINAACKEAGRQPEDVTLIAVSKNRSAEDILPLLENGQRVFGENRVQEAADKWPALRKNFPDVALHFIGQLQSNKAKDAVALFDVIHTVDRASLAEALSKEMQKQGKNLPCFIQVNTGDEAQKGGIAMDD